MKRMMIELTGEQLDQLMPMFEQVDAHNKDGVVCAIAAQIFPDGMHVKFFSGEQCKSLAESLGGDAGKTTYSAVNAYTKGMLKDENEE